MKKAVAVVLALFLLLSSTGCVKKNAERVIGYSALYNEILINEAFNTVEESFVKNFKGCILTELRYDEEVENKFADEIARYATEEGKELIIVLSTFETGSKGVAGSLNRNETYANWQWHLERTEDKKGWNIVGSGY